MLFSPLISRYGNSGVALLVTLSVSLSVLLSGPRAQAIDILDTAAKIFFKAGDRTRVGIEVEFQGMPLPEVAKLIEREIGGKTVTEVEMIKTTVKGHAPDGTPLYNEMAVTNHVVKGTSIGNVLLKPDFNQVQDDMVLNPKDIVMELVTEPIRWEHIADLQKVLTAIKENGGIGTRPDLAIATQVNVEFAGGVRADIHARDILDVLRSYLRPQHRVQITEHLQIPKIRQQYINDLSPGFMKLLLDPGYEPTEREFYDDYIYRQSLELLGKKNAWTLPIEDARKLLLSMDPVQKVHPTVVKLNALRASSLLMFMFPDDPMSKLYDDMGWAKGRPLLEFREWNTDFNITEPVKQALGIMEGARTYGYYDHDRLLSSITGLDEGAIRKIRSAVNKKRREGAFVFRYFLGDPKMVDRNDYAEQAAHYKVGQVDFLSYSTYGMAPMVIPGESVVFHRRHMHRKSILGKYNPGLINFNIQQALENKYVEAMFWDTYAPGSIPKTILAANVVERGRSGSVDIKKFAAQLKKEFPEGWVMKGVWDLGSEKNIITDKYDLVQEIATYKSSGFEAFYKKTLKENADIVDAAPEYIPNLLKAHPGYSGWKISKLLENPDNVIIQRKVNIDREFRVEIIGGKVLGKGSTMDRYFYLYKDPKNGLKMRDYVAPTPETIRKVEAWAQAQVDLLPPELRGMPFGMDVALLKDGSFSMAMIESNPGGNSNFLFEEEVQSVKVLGNYLNKYPELVNSGQIHGGLSPKAQMDYIREFLVRHKLEVSVQYPGMKFLEDEIIDSEFEQLSPKPAAYIVDGSRVFGKGKCQSLLKKRLAP